MTTFTFVLYWLVVFGLFVYGLNSLFLVWCFRRHRAGRLDRIRKIRRDYWRRTREEDLPSVTVQLPVYNERFVAGRVIHAAANLEYPRDRLEVQVLDDSTDDTVEIVRRHVEHYRKQGVAITHVRRGSRDGYKAGALRDGMAIAEGELLAVFDADFVPAPDFLRQTVPFFSDEQVGMVQARWGHANEADSPLTRVQALALDGHFGIEQGARGWAGFFMNFNGTAGLWRRKAIEDAGGWEADTLTEDLDLSYRAQLAGYRMEYLVDVEVPAEVPADVFAFKSQQRRWAKGSIETAKKLLPTLLRAPISVGRKVQAILHLTQHAVYGLLVTMALLGIPLVTQWTGRTHPAWLAAMIVMLGLSFLCPTILYVSAQRELRTDWRRRIRWLPVLMVVGTGLAVSNTRAIVEALLGIRSGFVRTPKRGDAKARGYRLPVDLTFAFEALLAAYCLVGLGLYLGKGRVIVGPFLLLFVLAFGSMAGLTLREAIRRRRETAGEAGDAVADPVAESEAACEEILNRHRGAADARRIPHSTVGEKR